MAKRAGKSFQLLEARVGAWPKVNWAMRALLMSTLVRLASLTKPVECLELARTRLRKGGLLIVDNTIWSGRVAKPDPDATTAAIMEFNRAAAADPALLTSILPLRDGVSVSLKL